MIRQQIRDTFPPTDVRQARSLSTRRSNALICRVQEVPQGDPLVFILREAGSVGRDATRAVVQQLQVDHDHRDSVRGIAPDADRIEPIAHAAADEDSGCPT